MLSITAQRAQPLQVELVRGRCKCRTKNAGPEIQDRTVQDRKIQDRKVQDIKLRPKRPTLKQATKMRQ